MSSSIHITIKNEYAKRLAHSNEMLAEKKAKLYSLLPRLEEIEREIQHEGISHNKQLLMTPQRASEIADRLQSAIQALQQERVSILQTHGYTPDYLEPDYQCGKCKDTGMLNSNENSNNITCRCYKQQLIDLIYIQSNLKCTESESFSTFNENYYSDATDENRYGIKKSPRRQILAIKDNCLKFIENFGLTTTKNLLFSGPTGSGKTFMSNCIAVELMNRGISVLYQTAPVLFSTINEYRFRSFKDEGYENSVYRNILEVDLLIIDDLGTEPPSAARYAELLTILDARLSNNLVRPCKTIISTNIDIKKLYEYYDERVGSRIVGNFDIFKFAGDDIRFIKASGN